MTDFPTTDDSTAFEPALTPEEEAAHSLGVLRHMTRTYSVGEYRYSTLSDAVAHARHLARGPKAASA